MSDILTQFGIMIVVVGIFTLYTEWRNRNYSTIIIKKIDAVMKKLIDRK